MNFDEFDKTLRAKAEAVKAGALKLSQKVAAEALRFVDDNFRNQSWEGTPWQAITRADGTILVDTARLKRSFNQDGTPGEVRIYSNVPYAAVHNEGFEGQVSIPAHKRSKYQKLKRGKKKKISTGEVRAHTRNANIKQRQFAPTATSPSPTLQKAVNETITEHFSEILDIRR
jgi:phage gpG-like protein